MRGNPHGNFNDASKAFEKILHPFVIKKILNNLGIENFLKTRKGIYEGATLRKADHQIPMKFQRISNCQSNHKNDKFENSQFLSLKLQ